MPGENNNGDWGPKQPNNTLAVANVFGEIG